MQQIHPAIVAPLKYNNELKLDMDILQGYNQEDAMILFVDKAKELSFIKIWSSYINLDSVEKYIKSFKHNDIEYIKLAAKKYF